MLHRRNSYTRRALMERRLPPTRPFPGRRFRSTEPVELEEPVEVFDTEDLEEDGRRLPPRAPRLPARKIRLRRLSSLRRRARSVQSRLNTRMHIARAPEWHIDLSVPAEIRFNEHNGMDFERYLEKEYAKMSGLKIQVGGGGSGLGSDLYDYSLYVRGISYYEEAVQVAKELKEEAYVWARDNGYKVSQRRFKIYPEYIQEV